MPISTSFLTLTNNRRIAYHLSEGEGPCVMFCGGFKSDMTGSKAMALEAFCRKKGRRFLRFDYTGHGQSSGHFKDGTIGQWKQDTLDVIDQLTDEKILLVGSSMGAWLALLAALERPQVIALVGIASAPDFTERLVWDAFSDAQKKQLMEEGTVLIPDCYGAEPYGITKALIEDGRKHLLLGGKIPLNIPIRLIHGTNDEDVPWQLAVELMEKLQSNDVTLQLIKNGNHRLSEPQQLEIICAVVDNLFASAFN